MQERYYYLIATLPMLEFGAKAPLSYDDFLLRCKEQLVPADMEIVERAETSPCEDINERCYLLKEWKRFDKDLRNEIARARANKKGKDPARYIRGEGYPNPFMTGLAQWAVNQASPLEPELRLDRARWEKLEEIGRYHYFDVGFLVIYALKLQILERWQEIDSGRGMKVLGDLLGA